MTNVSLSTMWSQGRFEHDMSGFVTAARRLGFDAFVRLPPMPGPVPNGTRPALAQWAAPLLKTAAPRFRASPPAPPGPRGALRGTPGWPG